MNEIIESGKTTMTSLELSEISGRRHDVMLKSIERMNEDLLLMSKPPAVVHFYKGWNGKEATMFILTIYHCELLALALDGIARIKILDKLEDMRRIIQSPQTYEQIMQHALLLADSKVKDLQNKIEIDRPKVSYAEAVAGSNTSMKVEDFVKNISSEIVIGRNKAFEWMREKWYLNKINKPYQQYIDMGVFECKENLIQTSYGSRSVSTTLVTGKWRIYLLEKLKQIEL